MNRKRALITGITGMVGSHLADYLQDANEVRMRANEMFDLYRSGKLHVAIDRVLPLDAARQAHEIIESRGARGKLLLKVG